MYKTVALSRSARCPRLMRRAGVVFVPLIAAALASNALAQVVGQSINMVTGTQWPTGDPFLERQNEPSMAVSSRNALHVVAGDNDYRTVDLPGVPCPTNTTTPCKPTGDAWLGFFTSIDGGNTWTSTLLPGYPQDRSSIGKKSVLHGYTTGADPGVRAGTNGMFYYSGLVFNRDSSGSAVFLARYVDGNNNQGANTVSYVDANIIATGGGTNFLDKPAIAVDIPRSGQTCSIPASGDGSVPASTIPAGNIYIAYTQFNGPESSNVSSIMFSQSADCGGTWSAPVQISKMVGKQQTNQGAALAIDPATGNVYVVWRIFKSSGQPDALAGLALQYSSNTFTTIVNKQISPFDQGTTGVSFRTNAYPSIAVDNSGIVYVAWAQRGSSTNKTTGGDARIQVLAGKPSYGSGTQIKGMQFGGPVTVDDYQGRGHQIMPALAYSSGNLNVAWYDFRDDDDVAVYVAQRGGTYSQTEELPLGVTPVFSTFVADPAAPYASNARRHTVDIRAARAPSGLPPAFHPSILVSQYAFGSPAGGPSDALPGDTEDIQQLEFDAPDLPMFQLGTVPFVGDYIDVAGPTFVPYLSGGKQLWRFNNLASDPDYTHIVWTDNRNVVQPADGNWANYTPVGLSTGRQSTFDPNGTAPNCTDGQTGVRNQDIYTATLSSGLIMGSKGNFIQSSSVPAREYPVTIENPTGGTLYYLLKIQNQPTSGTASFLQFPIAGQSPSTLTQLKIGVLPYSSASRSVFISSTDPNPIVSVSAVQTDGSFNLMPGGLSSTTALNSDTSNPNISNPNISNVEIYNPNISNPNISNPNISNPNISNPNISNPNISNTSFANPNISNPNISNPNISNPNISNPNISNPNISNTAISGEITDVNYTVTNTGNTSSSYSLTLLGPQPPPTVSVQLLISGVYLTPVANGCDLTVQANYNPIANVSNPTFVPAGSTLPSVPDPMAPTFSLQPGEQAVITLRVFDPNATTPQQALQDYNPTVSTSPVVISSGVRTDLPPPPPNAPPVQILSVTTTTLFANITSGTYTANLQASGGVAPYHWTALSGLPNGFTLTDDGVLSGTPASGIFPITVQVSDTGGQTVQATITLTVGTGLPPSLPAGQLPAPGVPNNYSVLPIATIGTPYTTTIPVTNGTPPFTWTATGVLPDGLTFVDGVISGTANGGVFAPPYDPSGWTPTASNGGTTTISPNCLMSATVKDATGATASANFEVGSTPSSSCMSFAYAINLGAGGVTQRTWTFTNTAQTSGKLSFHWRYTGFHAFFAVTAQLQAFVGSSNPVTLYQAGPQNCCISPSNGFDAEGDYSIPISAGQSFGFIVGGSNFDSDSILDGTLIITNFSIQ